MESCCLSHHTSAADIDFTDLYDIIYFHRLLVEMKGYILHLRRTSMRTICTCSSLWGRCLGKPYTRYICALWGNVLICCTHSEQSVLCNLQWMCNCHFCILRALLWMSRLPPSSSVKSWVTTIALSTAPSMSCPRWTLSFTRTSLPSRSARITPRQRVCHIFISISHLISHPVFFFCFFSAMMEM